MRQRYITLSAAALALIALTASATTANPNGA